MGIHRSCLVVNVVVNVQVVGWPLMWPFITEPGKSLLVIYCLQRMPLKNLPNERENTEFSLQINGLDQKFKISNWITNTNELSFQLW